MEFAGGLRSLAIQGQMKVKRGGKPRLRMSEADEDSLAVCGSSRMKTNDAQQMSVDGEP